MERPRCEARDVHTIAVRSPSHCLAGTLGTNGDSPIRMGRSDRRWTYKGQCALRAFVIEQLLGGDASLRCLSASCYTHLDA